MGRINRANFRKTIYYFKRNGIMNTWYAVRERLEERKQPPYVWTPPSEAELERQRRQWEEKGMTVSFSILVPAYRTKPEYLRELLDSLFGQTYPKWELVLADATEDDSVEGIIRDYLKGRGAAADDSSDVYKPGSAVAGSFAAGGFGENGCTRILYLHLKKNEGIAENTNQALPYASGDYVGLLDHDDVLEANALYEMAAAIEAGRQRGIRPQMLYSDEDKCNGDRTQYYEPNFKEDFNLDLLLSNNYICHFLVMDRKLMQKLKFRQEYDGAQDYDLVLRAAAELGSVAVSEGAKALKTVSESERLKGSDDSDVLGTQQACLKKKEAIVHIPKVLYHWRCHTGSTAENPQSKLYAYEAGRRAIQDFADRAGWRAKAVDTAHVGFYRLEYEGSLFDSRPDIGAVGGRVVGRGTEGHLEPGAALSGEKRVGSRGMAGHLGSGAASSGRKCVIGGRMAQDGSVFYENLPIHYSGYLHRAVLPQDAYAVDLRNIQVRPECRELFRQIVGVSYGTVPGTEVFDVTLLPKDCDIHRMSVDFGRALGEAGYRILYLPGKSRNL